MNQNELNRAVARVTGETVDRIQKMGFTLIVAPVVCRYRESAPPRPIGEQATVRHQLRAPSNPIPAA